MKILGGRDLYMSPPCIDTHKCIIRKKNPNGNQLKVDSKINLLIFEKDEVDVLIFLPQELHQPVIL